MLVTKTVIEGSAGQTSNIGGRKIRAERGSKSHTKNPSPDGRIQKPLTVVC